MGLHSYVMGKNFFTKVNKSVINKLENVSHHPRGMYFPMPNDITCQAFLMSRAVKNIVNKIIDLICNVIKSINPNQMSPVNIKSYL